MQEEEKKMAILQKKSHETLMKVLNNIGVIGAIIAAVADIVLVTIFVIGFKMDIDHMSAALFASVNAFMGLLINILLRYQGQKYAEIENAEVIERFYRKEAKKNKRYLSMSAWQAIQGVKDFVFKCASTAFSIFGVIYISIEGSKNPVQILIAFATLLLFACFGLMAMNSSYERFYNIQLPYMEEQLLEKGDKENATL